MEKTDSLKKRYLYKLLTNIAGFCISLFSQGIVLRGLGPKNFGDFNFLTSNLSQIVSFFDMGSSIGFYTKLSKRPKEKGLVYYYLYFVGIVFFLIFVFVLMTHLTTIYEKLWPDQALKFIYLAAGYAIINWALQIINSIGDAFGLTVSTERARIAQKIFNAVVIMLFFYLGVLNLTNYFLCYYLSMLLLIFLLARIINKDNNIFKGHWKASIQDIKEYTYEFYTYCHPLFIYSFFGVLFSILDRWMLQSFAGSVQQGFFGLSYQLSSICFAFTGAMTPLLTREFSIAYANKDFSGMARLFRRFIPLMYSVTAFFACFTAVQAEKVIYILGGTSYKGALLPVIIMAFYPIHQTYGQMSGSIFYAADKTKTYRNIGITLMVVGLPITYILIAPKSIMGLDTGAVGLAAKMVLMQFLGVNVQLYFNAKLLKLKFWKYVLHQLISVSFFIGIGLVSAIIGDILLGLKENTFASFIVEGVIYTVIVLVLVYLIPEIVGLSKKDVKSFSNILITKYISRLKD
ncbi:MAG: oligosaccharide flippase family protein [Clostridia bacterium]|nr:oligosaccharide flippase family protein [Clostridia bacterium]